MQEYEEKLQQFVKDNSIVCEFLHFETSTHSVSDAAKAAHATEDELVKNICLLDKDGKLIVSILKGEDKLDFRKVGEILKQGKPRFATSDETLAKTGYPIGGVPSFGYDATFLIDEKVMEKDVVYSGGGSDRALVKIGTTELLGMNKGKVVDIRK